MSKSLSCHNGGMDFTNSFTIRLLHPAGLLDNILCPYKAVVDKF